MRIAHAGVRSHAHGTVSVILTRPARSRTGREGSVESEWIPRTPRVITERTRAAVDGGTAGTERAVAPTARTATRIANCDHCTELLRASTTRGRPRPHQHVLNVRSLIQMSVCIWEPDAPDQK